MDVAERILAAESGIFIAAPADIPHLVAAEIAASIACLIHVGQNQNAQRAIEEALSAAGLAELSDALQRPIVLMIEAVERYASSDLLYELKAARDELNRSSRYGLRVVFFGSDPLVLRSLCRHQMAAFFCAELLDVSSVGEGSRHHAF